MSSWRQRRWGGAGCRRTGLTQLLGGRGCGVGIPAVTHTLLRTLFWAPGPQAISPVTPRASESAGPGPASRARWAVVSSPALQPTPPAGLLHGPEGGPGAWERLPLQEDAGLSALPGVRGHECPKLAEDRALSIAWCAVGWGVMCLFHKKARPSSLEAGEG